MRTRFEAALARYGQSVTVTDRSTGAAADGRAFVQPLLRRQETPPVDVTALGAVSGERWLYLGPAGLAVAVGDRVTCGGGAFTVQEAREVLWRDETAYRWAMLRPEKEDAV